MNAVEYIRKDVNRERILLERVAKRLIQPIEFKLSFDSNPVHMKKSVFLFALFIVFSITTAFAQNINTAASSVKFEIGNMWVNTVEGTFTGMTGTIQFDPANLSAAHFNVCIDAASVKTDSQERDDHLRTADFFDVAKYPKICLVSKKIERQGEGFRFIGDLTMHGVTREVAFNFSYAGNKFIGHLEVKRLDYNIGTDSGTFAISDEAELEIICVVK